MRRNENYEGQWELNVKTSKVLKARENAGDQVAFGFSFNLIGRESSVSFLWTNHEAQESKYNINVIQDYFWHSI